MALKNITDIFNFLLTLICWNYFVNDVQIENFFNVSY